MLRLPLGLPLGSNREQEAAWPFELLDIGIIAMENEDEGNSKFKDDIAEVLEYNKKKRKPANGAGHPEPDLGKLGDLLKKKADENKSDNES